MLILVIKILLVIASIISVGTLPLLALLYQWIWNTFVAGTLLTYANPITSYWIALGFTAMGGMPFAIKRGTNYINK